MTDPTDPLADLDALLNQLTGTTDPEPPLTDTTPTDTTLTDTAETSTPEPLFPDLGAFVDGYLTQVVERRVATGAASGVCWCRRWWAHPEALSRIYALWRAWETLRVSDPATGMSIWWRDHLDPHLAALTSEYGPFNRCRADKHTAPATLPADPMPPDVLAQLPDASGG